MPSAYVQKVPIRRILIDVEGTTTRSTFDETVDASPRRAGNHDCFMVASVLVQVKGEHVIAVKKERLTMESSMVMAMCYGLLSLPCAGG